MYISHVQKIVITNFTEPDISRKISKSFLLPVSSQWQLFLTLILQKKVTRLLFFTRIFPHEHFQRKGFLLTHFTCK